MPGTSSGSVDHRTNTATAAANNQEFFTNLFRFFNGPLRSGSYVDLVALQTGSAAGGRNFHDQNNPFGENAFAVFRVRSGSVPGAGPSARRRVDYYFLMQWADTNNFGAAPGAPGLVRGAAANDGVGVALAWRDDGTNPWNGTSAATGNDAKGTPVWSSGSSTVRVFPRSNNPGGSHDLNKENTHRIFDLLSAGTTYRYHFVADRDCLVSFIDSGDNLGYDAFYYHGTFEPLNVSTFVTAAGGNMQMPMSMMGSDTVGALSPGSTYGDAVGTAATNGGIVGATMSGGATVRSARTDRFSNNLLGNTSLQPNPQFVASRYDEFRIPIMVFESPDFGHVGYLDCMTEVFNAAPHDVTSGSSKAVLGPSAGGSVEHVVHWSGSAPGSVSTREGRFF